MVSNKSGRIQFLLVLAVILIVALSIPIFISYAYARPANIGSSNSQHGISLDRSVHYRNVADKINSEGSLDVIIIIEDNSSVARKSSIKTTTSVESSDERRLSTVAGFEEHRKLGIINGYSGRLTRQGLIDLKNSGLNVRVYEDKMLYIVDDAVMDNVDNVTPETLNDSSINVSNVNISGVNASELNVSEINTSGESSITDEPSINSNLNVATASVNANYSWNVLNITGSGVKVALIDTGIDYTHPDLGGCFGYGTNTNCKVFDGYDFYNNDNNPMDDHTFGHGTHVAGIFGANGTIRGVAPNATIYALKACSSSGSCLTSTVITAMGWAKDHGAQIIGMSIGSYVSYEDYGNSGKDPFSIAVDNMVSQGIVVVISASNNGPGASTIGAPGASESAITVGAVEDKNTPGITDDSIWLESSRGPGAFGRLDPEICAPGYQIQSTSLNGSYISLTGTSMASPFVSGASALLLNQNPSLTPLQIRAILIQSTDSISGKLFDRGVGELDIRRVLTGKVYALITHSDSYGRNVINDRWEFVVTPYTTSYANITIINDNPYNVTFSTIIETLDNMENSITLNTSQLSILPNMTIANNSNYTLNVNFTLANFSSTYATTYGGVIYLNGSGFDNASNASVSKTIRIPVVITIPIMNYAPLNTYASFNRTLDTDSIDGSYTNTNPVHEDVYFYAYYNNNSRNVQATITWPLVSDWLSLYLYNSTGDFDVSSKGSGVNIQTVSTTKQDSFKWIRIDGYDFNTTVTFNMNIAELGNHAPIIINVTDANGANNGTNISTSSAYALLFYRPSDVIVNISYYDYDNDSVIISVNDSRYQLINSSSSLLTSGQYGAGLYGNTVYKMTYNYTIPNTGSIFATSTDPYGAATSQAINIFMRTSISILSYSPTNSTIFARKNDTQNFTVDAIDLGNKSLYYYWSVNNALNSTTQNFSFNTTNYNLSTCNISLLISNNASNNSTNESLSWNVNIDGAAPVINIQNPAASSIQNYSRVNLNYTARDNASSVNSGTNDCWYSINGTAIIGNSTANVSAANVTLQSCSNTTLNIANGVYTLNVYSSDTVDNIGYSNVPFRVNDSTAPNITGAVPYGSSFGSGTASVTVSLFTDENATCRYSDSDIAYDSMIYTFTDNVFNHTSTYNVNSGTTYTLYARCSDMSNNTDNVSTMMTFSIDAVQNPGGGGGNGGNGGNSGGSSSGGGTGGGVIIGDEGNDNGVGSDNVATNTVDKLSSGETNISISKDAIPVNRIGLDVNGTFYNVRVIVTKMNYSGKINDSYNSNTANMNNDNNTDITYDDGIVYEYFTVDYDNIAPASLKGAKIYFEISKDWLKNNNLSIEGVELVKYDPIYGWKILSPELLTQDYDKVYYVAYSTELGLFAIAHENITEYASGPVVRLNESNITKDSTPHVVSGENSTSTRSNIQGIYAGIINKLSNARSQEWIALALFSIFIIVAIIGLVVRQKSIKRYGKELIKETNREFIDEEKGFEKIDKITLKQEANVLFKAQEPRMANMHNTNTNNMHNAPVYRTNTVNRTIPDLPNRYANNQYDPKYKYTGKALRNLGFYKKK